MIFLFEVSLESGLTNYPSQDITDKLYRNHLDFVNPHTKITA